MASTKPVPAKSRPARSGKKGKQPEPPKRGPVAGVKAAARAAQERLAAAREMPGWRGVRTVIGAALAAGDTALLLEMDAEKKAARIRRRTDGGWQPPGPLVVDDAAAVLDALAKLAVAPADADDPGFVVAAWKCPRRQCRVEARKTPRSEQVVVLLGPELPRPERPRIGSLVAAALGRLVPSFLRRTPPPERDPTLPLVELAATGPDAEARSAAVAEDDGYEPACDLVAAAVRDRANEILITGGPQGVTVQFDVDGVPTPAPPLDTADIAATVGVLRTVAGLDPKARGPQAGRITALVQDKPWACTVTARRGSSGESVAVAIDHARPTFKTVADTGVSAAVAEGLRALVKSESGLIVLAGPRSGGLSTLIDTLVFSADRLLRDFILLEDEVAPRPAIQNVKPFRWDSRTGGTPAAALEAALREYPNVLVTSDLEDADLAQRLVAQAAGGRLVIAGIRGADAADGVARLASLGIDRRALAQVLLGAAGVRLVRKLCPKCRHEYFPDLKVLSQLKLDPDVAVTLFRPPAAGCPVCTGTGYLGRTAAAELAAGPALQAGVEKAADATVLRHEAVKGGMVSVLQDAIAKVACGVTSVEEVQRVFRRA